MSPLKEGTDYYINEEGLFVFTEAYHLNRGYCCKSGCKHCPYGFKKARGNNAAPVETNRATPNEIRNRDGNT